MRKDLIICVFALTFFILIKNSMAVDCIPTASWKVDSQFYVGETSKLIATITNNCNKSYEVKTEINTEKTYGYIKVYRVISEDESPRPKIHSDTTSGIVETLLESKETKKIVYFIQPDETTLSGRFILYENLYIGGELKDTKEISINVAKPLQITYGLPQEVKFNAQTSSSVSIINKGFEMIESLKICLSSPIDVVSFSEECKTWEKIPSNFNDKFNLMLTGLNPGKYENAILVKTDYKTYTGIDLSETYYVPSIRITTQQTGSPSLSYQMKKGNNNLTIAITNQGKGNAYDCNLLLYSPLACKLNSDSLTRSTSSEEYNIYEIEGKNEILADESFAIVFNFNSSQITPPCMLRGSISYKDGSGNVIQKEISNYDLIPVATTTVPAKKVTQKNSIYVILIAIIAVVIIVFVFLRLKRAKKQVQKNI